MIVFVCLYITPSQCYHCANLSEDIELIKCLSDIFCRVCKIEHILCYPAYNMWDCVFSVYPFPLWWLRDYIYTLSYYHNQSGSMNYYPLFRVREWNNSMCCMSLYILMIIIGPSNPSFIFKGGVNNMRTVNTSWLPADGWVISHIRPSIVPDSRCVMFYIQ